MDPRQGPSDTGLAVTDHGPFLRSQPSTKLRRVRISLVESRIRYTRGPAQRFVATACGIATSCAAAIGQLQGAAPGKPRVMQSVPSSESPIQEGSSNLTRFNRLGTEVTGPPWPGSFQGSPAARCCGPGIGALQSERKRPLANAARLC